MMQMDAANEWAFYVFVGDFIAVAIRSCGALFVTPARPAFCIKLLARLLSVLATLHPLEVQLSHKRDTTILAVRKNLYSPTQSHFCS
jgi:hypothetical protein